MRTPIPPLTVSSPATAATGVVPRTPSLPWWVVVVAGAWVAVLVGWAAVGLVVAGAWLTATWLPAATVWETVGRGWLAVHGVDVVVGGVALGLAPSGVTLLVGVALAAVAHRAASAAGPGAARAGWRPVGRTVGSVALAYGLAAGLVGLLVGSPVQAAHAAVAAAALGGVGGLAGAAYGRPELLGPLPAWARILPQAVGIGLAALGVASAAAVAVGLALRWPRVVGLQESLAPDGPGVWLLAALGLAWAPTILLWGGSWLLGAGFTVGVGTLVAPGVSRLGLLPALPVLGAVPTAASPWDWAALAAGLAAGAAAGGWWWRAAARSGYVPTLTAAAWQGGLAGLGTAAAWLAASWLARGGLGSGRLADLGPRFPELLAFAPALLVAGAAAAAVGTAAYARRPRR